VTRAAAFALLAAALAGCAPPVWDVAGLAAREPGLRALDPGRLGDATPYLLPLEDVLVMFLCRWDGAQPIPVRIAPEPSPEQRGAIDAALRAWEQAGLGVRFAPGAPGPGIELELISGAAAGAGEGRGATTVADCAVDPAGAKTGERLAARLVAASIQLAVESRDPLGRPIPVEAGEIAGAALHELGHALGFQGHARFGSSVMGRQVDGVRRAGRRLLAGEPFADATLRALYAVPSGRVVARLPLPPGRTQPIDALLALVRAGSLRGPIARVGDLEGEILFEDAGGAAYAVWLRPIGALLAGRPEELLLLPGPRAQQRLSLRSPPCGSRARGRPAPRRSCRARAARHRAGTA
jgi:hypothetical protein